MFFQSVYAQYTQFGQNAVQVDLYINKNAERDETYLGNQAYTQAPSTNVFQVANATVHADTNTEKNGLPTFGAQIQGITDPNPYFLLDFTADHTIVWSYNCNTTGIGKYPAASCAAEPTNMQTGFDGYGKTENGVFQGNFGGYVCSGLKYETQVCFGGSSSRNCKFVDIYAADQVSQNNWMMGEDGTYGILGMGPNSKFFEGFVDPISRLAVYSIELGRVPMYG